MNASRWVRRIRGRAGGKDLRPGRANTGRFAGDLQGDSGVFRANLPLFLAEKITEALFFKGKLQKLVDFKRGFSRD